MQMMWLIDYLNYRLTEMTVYLRSIFHIIILSSCLHVASLALTAKIVISTTAHFFLTNTM
jgi:hypothetical protein